MNLESLKQIAKNPAASAHERNVALKQMASVQKSDVSSDTTVDQLLAHAGATSLVEVSPQQMTDFARASGCGEAALQRIDKIRSAMVQISFWSRYLGSTGKDREDSARLIELLFYDADTDEKRRAWADAELAAAHKTLRELGAE